MAANLVLAHAAKTVPHICTEKERAGKPDLGSAACIKARAKARQAQVTTCRVLASAHPHCMQMLGNASCIILREDHDSRAHANASIVDWQRGRMLCKGQQRR